MYFDMVITSQETFGVLCHLEPKPGCIALKTHFDKT